MNDKFVLGAKISVPYDAPGKKGCMQFVGTVTEIVGDGVFKVWSKPQHGCKGALDEVVCTNL